MKNQISFYDEVKDPITGFRGTVTAMAEYVTGCKQFLVTPKYKKNQTQDGQWFDEPRLELVKYSKKYKVKSDDGGPECNAPKK
jgi:hypothetical protein